MHGASEVAADTFEYLPTSHPVQLNDPLEQLASALAPWPRSTDAVIATQTQVVMTPCTACASDLLALGNLCTQPSSARAAKNRRVWTAWVALPEPCAPSTPSQNESAAKSIERPKSRKETRAPSPQHGCCQAPPVRRDCSGWHEPWETRGVPMTPGFAEWREDQGKTLFELHWNDDCGKG